MHVPICKKSSAISAASVAQGGTESDSKPVPPLIVSADDT